VEDTHVKEPIKIQFFFCLLLHVHGCYQLMQFTAEFMKLHKEVEKREIIMFCVCEREKERGERETSSHDISH